MPKKLFSPSSIKIFDNSNELCKYAAERIIETTRNYKDAVIVLPTGDTPRQMYAELVKRFEDDRSIDFSNVTFFNLDEYIGLPKEHPLSYNYYMNKLFYSKLDVVDKHRAPKLTNRNIPFVEKSETPKTAAEKYSKKLMEAIKKTKRNRVDLTILGIGPAYPASLKGKKLKGGHIGFNEPGTKVTDKTRPVALSQKTILDTSFRFLNLRFCKDYFHEATKYKIPKKAITLGIKEILNSREILLLASGEEKMPVIESLYDYKPTSDFPATYLKYHNNVHWLLDKDAASKLPHVKMPWTVNKNIQWTKDLFRQAVIEILIKNKNLKLSDVEEHLIEDLKIPFEKIKIFGGISKIKHDVSTFLKDSIHTEKNILLPKNSRVVIFSPHPDDDVITMAITIKKLKELNNEIWIVYMVNGENSVKNQSKEVKQKFRQILKDSGEKNIDSHRKDEFYRLARIKVREEEAIEAASMLKIPKERLFFLNLPYYYHRGLVCMEPIDYEKDVMPVIQTILEIRPQHVFYSAESDPHGAHGLGAKILALAFEKLGQFWDETFWGYRGAYEEWPIFKPEGLVIVPFDRNNMNFKISCIKAHRSQLKPIFPSFDNREFWQRAKDRNRHIGHLLEKMGYFHYGPIYAEVFKKMSYAEFIRVVG